MAAPRPGETRASMLGHSTLIDFSFRFILALGVGAAAAMSGTPRKLAFVCLSAVVLIAVSFKRRLLPLSFFFLLVSLPLPSLFPLTFTAVDVVFYVADLVLILALIMTPRMARERFGGAVPIALAGVLLLSGVNGLLHGATLDALTRDLRPWIYLLATFHLGLSASDAISKSLASKVVLGVLWFSAIGIALSLLTRQPLVGGTFTSATTGVPGFDNVSVTRFQLNSTMLGLLVLCTCLALSIALDPGGKRRPRFLLPYGAPALAIVFFAFARNSLLALVASLIVVLLAISHRAQLVQKLPTFLLVIATVLVPIAVISGRDSESAIARGLESYDERVIAGLSGSAIRDDVGLQLRRMENEHALATFLSYPIIGKGLGTTYRPIFNDPFEPFPAGIGPTYAHNVYLWFLAKLGLVGLLTLTPMFLAPIVIAVREHRRIASSDTALNLAVAAGIAGIMAVGVVAPHINTINGAPVIGIALGYLYQQRAGSTR